MSPSPMGELEKVTAIAHTIVNAAIPSDAASESPAEDWPSNVASIEYIDTSRQAAAEFIDGAPTPDDRQVFVIRLIGEFTEAIPGPQGGPPTASGRILTVVADRSSSEVIDSNLRDAATPGHLPHATSIYSRQ